MPQIASTLGADYDRAPGRSSRIGIVLGSANREFLDRVWREILKEASDVIVVIVSAIHRQIDVEARAAVERDRRYPRLGRVRGLDRLRHRCQVSYIGKASSGKGKFFQVLRPN